ncbi:MAG: hypothetical protein DHS20C14_18870 [Phycisphaeraceae bacterium]|nr:MAG: hypothetical protein DHS20C14_18870 [Phycisphaeraceae bacterium]
MPFGSTRGTRLTSYTTFMNTWQAQCINQETGDEFVRQFMASSQDEVLSQAHELGLVVGSVKELKGKSRPTHPQALAPVPKPQSSRSELVHLRIVGFTFLAIGILGLIGSYFANTATVSETNYGITSVHNIGLLNDRLLYATFSGSALIAGAVFYSASVLGTSLRK